MDTLDKLSKLSYNGKGSPAQIEWAASIYNKAVKDIIDLLSSNIDRVSRNQLPRSFIDALTKIIDGGMQMMVNCQEWDAKKIIDKRFLFESLARNINNQAIREEVK